jgi:hypothetical protein
MPGPVDTTFLMRSVDRLLDRGARFPTGSSEQMEADVSAFELLDRVLELQGIPRAALQTPDIAEPSNRNHPQRRSTRRNAVKTGRIVSKPFG